MLFDLLWNDNPPITKFLFVMTIFLALIVTVEPELESKMFLLKGKEGEVWRYLTNLLFMGKLSARLLLSCVLR